MCLYTVWHEGLELSCRPGLWTVHSAGWPTLQRETSRDRPFGGQRGCPSWQHTPQLLLEAGAKCTRCVFSVDAVAQPCSCVWGRYSK